NLQTRIAARQRVEKGDEPNVAVAPAAARVGPCRWLPPAPRTGWGGRGGVIVGPTCGQAAPHRQQRQAAVKRLNLRLFVYAQHQRSLGRVQIQPDDVSQLLLELELGIRCDAR